MRGKKGKLLGKGEGNLGRKDARPSITADVTHRITKNARQVGRALIRYTKPTCIDEDEGGVQGRLTSGKVAETKS